MKTIRTRLPHVVLWLPTSIKACRELMRGVLNFVHFHGPWALYLLDERTSRTGGFDPVAWGCTGMIVDMRNREQAERLLAIGVPAVLSHVPDDLCDARSPLSAYSRLQCENSLIGIRAAEHLIERRYRHFAYVGDPTNASWSAARQHAFGKRLRQNGFTGLLYPCPTRNECLNFSEEQNKLCAWLTKLPKPVALFAANDARARQVLDSCLKTGFAVPQEVAVLGVDNDELICETAQPQLSSIQMSTEQAGFEAARRLDRMMRGNPGGTSRQPVISFGFSHLVVRRSTEIVQIDDPLVARAEEFIRINAATVITVSDLVRHLRVSRRWLEKRFKSQMGHTLYAEIQRVRLQRVQLLLRESSLPIEEIAVLCGFYGASHLGTLFKQHVKTTPGAYRRAVRQHGL
ncbi:MAG: DNA-binding transcriptional regulator [Kiritimatiellia bacterium]|jgi:LacI family transcriptional regulator|nr:DNA-binding transcriptional regulator [Kiritimatiellia bacterium]